MRKSLLKSVLLIGLLSAAATVSRAQKFGDNLGNHTATKDLQMGNMNIVNAKGVAIGTATLLNASVALEIGTNNTAILISRVNANTDIANPVNGMIIYNNTDQKFYLRQASAWVTFALSMKASTTGIETTSNANGYTLTQDGEELVLKLTPADATHPGIVTTGAQEFGGNKTFVGGATVSTALTVNAPSTLNGTLAVNGDVAVGDSVNTKNTMLNGALTVTGKTTLSAAADVNGTTSPMIQLKNTMSALPTEAQTYLVVDADGNVKKGVSSKATLAKYLIAIPAAQAGNDFDPEGNSAALYFLLNNDIKKDDAIVVNFAADDEAKFTGLSILSAVAVSDGKVAVRIADLRNPAATANYTAPNIVGASLVVTKYNSGQ